MMTTEKRFELAMVANGLRANAFHVVTIAELERLERGGGVEVSLDLTDVRAAVRTQQLSFTEKLVAEIGDSLDRAGDFFVAYRDVMSSEQREEYLEYCKKLKVG